MSAHHHDEHGGGHHAGNPSMDWLILHMGGLIMSFGKRFEKCVEAAMMPIINGVFLRLARFYLFIFAPVVLIQFLAYFAADF
jgi:hypothetical protein